MGAMKELDIILHNIVDEGIESGFIGSNLKSYVYDEAVNTYKLSGSIVKPFVEAKVDQLSEEIFE